MSAFNVCLQHKRFFPCVSHVRNDCRWSDTDEDVWAVSEHIISTTAQERADELRHLCRYEPSGMDEFAADTSWNTGNTP